MFVRCDAAFVRKLLGWKYCVVRVMKEIDFTRIHYRVGNLLDEVVRLSLKPIIAWPYSSKARITHLELKLVGVVVDGLRIGCVQIVVNLYRERVALIESREVIGIWPVWLRREPLESWINTPNWDDVTDICKNSFLGIDYRVGNFATDWVRVLAGV